MAISDLWSQATIRSACQRELLDPSARFWSTTELDGYIDDWQAELQDKFEFVWGSSTQVLTNTSTILINMISPDMSRLDAVYYNNRRLPGRSIQDLEEISRQWAATSNTDPEPVLAYQNDSQDVVLWPPVVGTGTVELEYPVLTTFTATTDLMVIPAWTKYSAINYVAMKALLRDGPGNSPTKALRYKKQWDNNLKKFRLIWDKYFPYRSPRLKPATTYEERIINPSRRPEVRYE